MHSLGALPGVQALAITGAIADTREAVSYAVSRGEPAFDPNILCVVATDRAERRAAYSNFAVSQSPDNVVAAPGGAAVLACGEDIVSTVPSSAAGSCSTTLGTPGYDAYAGTSMATPHVAGVSCAPDRSRPVARGRDRILKQTARTPVTGTRGTYTPAFGHGIVDAEAAVAAP